MRIRALSAVFALTLTIVSTVPAAADSPQATADEITLVSGDKVSLGPDGTVTRIRPGEGRTGITFRIHRKPDGHTLVIPSDATAPLAAPLKESIRQELDRLGLLRGSDKSDTVGCFVRSAATGVLNGRISE